MFPAPCKGDTGLRRHCEASVGKLAAVQVSKHCKTLFVNEDVHQRQVLVHDAL
jgi:hypothetical protein